MSLRHLFSNYPALLLGLSLQLLLSLASGSAHADAPLRVSIVDLDPPYSFIQPDGTPAGLMVELWRYWGRVNQREIEFVVSASYPQAIGQVLAGDTDVLAGMDPQYGYGQSLIETRFAVDDPVYLFTHATLGKIQGWEEIRPYRIAVSKTLNLPTLAIPEGYTYDGLEGTERIVEAARRGDYRVAIGRQIATNFLLRTEKLSFHLNSGMKIANNRRSARIRAGNDVLLGEINRGFKRLEPKRLRSIVAVWGGVSPNDEDLIITLPQWAPPYATTTTEGESLGLLPDLWRLWGQKTGVSVRFLPMEPTHSEEMVIRGLADIVGVTFSPLPERMSLLNYPTVLLPIKLGVYVPESSGATRLADLIGTPIAMYNAPHLRALLLQHEPGLSFTTQEPFTAYMQSGLEAFVSSTAVINDPTGHRANSGQHYRLLSDSLLDDLLLAAVPRHRTELATRVREGMEKITPKELGQLEQKWLPNPQDHFYNTGSYRFSVSPEGVAWISNNPVIRVGLPEGDSTTAQNSNFNKELIQLLGDYLPVRFETRFYEDSASSLEAITNGEVDMVADVGGSEHSQAPVNYSFTYKRTPWVIATPDQQVALRSVEEMEGQSLAVIPGTAITEQLLDYPGVSITNVSSIKAGLDKVINREVQGYAGSLSALSQYIQENGIDGINLHRIPELKDDQVKFAIRSDWPELTHMINRVITISDDGKLRQLRKKWLALRIQQGIDEGDLWIERLKVGAIAALILAVVLFWNRRLRKEIIKRKLAEEEVRHLATHDTLTGLPNRRLLWDRISKSLAIAKRNQQKVALLFIDLDGFKAVNDTLGHDAGDELLKEVAERIKKSLRESDTVARIGGDEFVVLLPAIQQADGAAQVAQSLLDKLSQPFQLQSEAHIGASIGIALYPDSAGDAEELMSLADNLMYKVKKSGKNSYAFA
ncbi:diguanylate cyclase domain-containing protein [Aestuariirhabdus litorea]|uniref:Diguanylate cyclase n=1 Tax=Aestuariirhabdus litorea TaxID=2528527 RepID=A0A3P3VQR8_9GAMM|nr:diguanylate cyclase [Aestuariirhabdus litorea]RRJ84970.1 diguanylate cyclase [Aestuariirhabdus litorea]RWW98194.1 diguanylate cyclase [Endozoicomonadaceae bacterium GTF-13]